ncbi:DUF3618 domain-containing protein [Gymnodinialimonas sp. 2305UL16-5]|uniref:DUF3618 domain-containing protein n=1 Tax=Gymnodinialimonas mytili TaxID=3126503 RepID=UPI0030B25F1F
MTSETRSPGDIEREIEAQRSDLTSNIEALQEKFSVETIVREIGNQFREHGGDIGRSVSAQAKANPIPLALTAIGLAWLIFGPSRSPAAASFPNDRRASSRRRPIDATTPRDDRAGSLLQCRSTRYENELFWSQEDDDATAGAFADQSTSYEGSVRDAEDDVTGSPTRAAASMIDTAKDARERVSDGAKSTIAGANQSARDTLADARHRIAHGTETLTEAGRQRVIAARQKAVDMRRQALQSLDTGSDAVADFYTRQPLVVGALAIAVGAAIGGALPRSKAEDDLMGGQSDALFKEAERIFEEEKAKAVTVAKTVAEEASRIADKTKEDLDSKAPGDKTATEALQGKAEAAADRLADTAQETAKDEKLGKPNT